MFLKFNLEFEHNMFDELSSATKFENVMRGRLGAIIVDVQKDNLIPLVRTTTMYETPPQKFAPIHHFIIEQVKKITNNPQLEFNNALVEIYNSDYMTMGYHSDQALDLKDDSYVCIYSCYDRPSDVRKLLIQNKTSKKSWEIILDHNSCVLFSLETNREHLHKIILDKNTNNNRWLGITFRLSKTFVNFMSEKPYIYPIKQKVLTMATDAERKEFYKCRGNENRLVNYTYPEINYTISASDLMSAV